MAVAKVWNRTRGEWVADRATIANTSALRRQGLLRHDQLGPGEGLWIVPCEGVHTFGMRFPIDVVFLSKDKRVLKVRREMGRARISLCLRAHSVLELAAGAARVEPGDQLEFERLA